MMAIAMAIAITTMVEPESHDRFLAFWIFHSADGRYYVWSILLHGCEPWTKTGDEKYEKI